MRIKHVLWRVGNGWIRTTDDNPFLSHGAITDIFVFDNLRQFSDWATMKEKKEKEKERKSPNDK